MKPSLAGRERNEMKLENAGKKEVVAAKVAIPGVYHEGLPLFLWTRSVFYLIKVAPAVSRPGKSSTDLHKLLWKIGGVGIARVKLPELDRNVRRELVNAAKAVMTAKPGVAEKAVAEGLDRLTVELAKKEDSIIKDRIPVNHIVEYDIVRQAAKELAAEPVAEAAVRKHIELGGKPASHPKAFAELVMNGPAKPEVGLAALSAACWKLKDELKPYLEAEAEAIVRKYVEGGGKFVPRAKELAELIMAAKKPLVDFYTMAGACYKLIPGYRDKIRKEEDAGIDAILHGRMGQSGGKSGATIGDALKFQAEGKPGRDRPRKGGHDHRRDKGDDEGRGGGKRR